MSFPTPPHLERLNRKKPNPIKPMKMMIEKLTEPSTIRGVIALLGAFGITVQPEYHEHIIAAVLALIGIINVWRKESKIPKAEVVE
jgi:PII-like signaling protein